MTQLIIVVMSIALTGMMVAATVNYLPGWVLDYERSAPIVSKGFCRLEAAVLEKIAASGVAPLHDSNASDGGLAQHFSAYYQFLPRAPDGAAWVYGTETLMSGQVRPYICLAGGALSEGTYRALLRMRGSLPETQFLIGAACAGGTVAEPASFPAALSPTLLINPVEPYIPSTAC